ncbi:MAG: adenylosuccinate lyase [Candidatus Aenigmarchaeota archaeon]|nr:adenylosuccinate lyase [Candidatus Aenigmarchaeota archaeon]
MIHPTDYRYLVKDLEQYLSDEAFLQYKLEIEAAYIETLAEIGVCPKDVAEEIVKKTNIKIVTPELVRKKEAKLKHDIRAMVSILADNVSDKAKPFVHLGLTSYDVVNTAQALMLKDVTKKIILPSMIELEKKLIELAENHKDTIQIGRTHGQHAEPITFGFYLSGYVDRLGEAIEKIRKSSEELRGKVSGAVGTKAALKIIYESPEKIEKIMMDKLGLKPARISTQIVPPEYLADYLSQIIIAFSIIADLANDMRQLQRTEIAEVSEMFSQEQVGSSTMPQKRNPVSWENIVSQWKAVMPHIVSVYMDILSEHQRDLTNSASSRYYIPEIINAFVYSIKRTKKNMDNLVVNKERMLMNLKMTGMIAAEPLYIILAMSGHPDAHKYVKDLVSKSIEKKISLLEMVKKDEKIRELMENMPEEKIKTIRNIETYIGTATKTTEKITKLWRAKLGL